jgi:hypothetical protein
MSEHRSGRYDPGNDWEVDGDLTLRLPLDVSKRSEGRLFEVKLASTDDSGNEGFAKAWIRVGFDRGRPKVALESWRPELETPASETGTTAKVVRTATQNATLLEGSSEGSEKPLIEFGLLGVGPNPVRGPGQVQFSLADTSPIRLAVYDVRGRLVRTLARQTYSPGLHSIAWEPRSDDGTPLSQGIYFVRLNVDGKRFTRRFVVIH